MGTGFRSLAPIEALQHVSDIRRAARIAEDRRLHLIGGKSRADCQSENVDDFVGVRPNEMGAEDALGSLLDQYLESGAVLANPSRAVPFRGLLVLDTESELLLARLLFEQPDAGERRNREHD